jgi:8-oxo-dGTP diphosphatase
VSRCRSRHRSRGTTWSSFRPRGADGVLRSLFVAGHDASQIADTHLILERQGGQVLLLVRANTGYMDGMAGLPSGHVEPEESADSAIIREAKEEIGIVIDPADLAFAHVMHRRTSGEDIARVSFFFAATRWTGDVVNAEPDKCAGLIWSDVVSLPDNTIGYIADALTAVRAGQGFSARGW